MTHRLQNASATDEDSEIWLSIILNYMDDWATVGVIFRDAGRCDTELMRIAQFWRRGRMVIGHTYAFSGPLERFAIDGKRCGGDITRYIKAGDP